MTLASLLLQGISQPDFRQSPGHANLPMYGMQPSMPPMHQSPQQQMGQQLPNTYQAPPLPQPQQPPVSYISHPCPVHSSLLFLHSIDIS